MKSFVISHTQQLFKVAIITANRNNVKYIPYPKNSFKNDIELKLYLNDLTNFLSRP